jgi:beta-lactam-binding protein with PASTA domain
MALLNPQKVKDIWIHLTLISVSAMVLLFCFFYVYLPSASNHGETITVPKLEGMSVKEMEDFLSAKKLDFVIKDSIYQFNAKPLTVVKQYPAAGAKVKQDRRLFIIIASATVPKIAMPDLFDESLRQAELRLKDNGLLLDSIYYIPGGYHNVVLKQLVNQKEVPKGTLISKGTKVTLVLGTGTNS